MLKVWVGWGALHTTSCLICNCSCGLVCAKLIGVGIIEDAVLGGGGGSVVPDGGASRGASALIRPSHDRPGPGFLTPEADDGFDDGDDVFWAVDGPRGHATCADPWAWRGGLFAGFCEGPTLPVRGRGSDVAAAGREGIDTATGVSGRYNS